MRALITGIGGFVGPYLRRELERNGHLVYGLDRSKSDNGRVFQCDITDAESVNAVIRELSAECVFHLAGFSSVENSWKDRERVHAVNVGGTENLVRALEQWTPNARMLVVSSAEVYGIPQTVPIPELHVLRPITPYGESRKLQEEAISRSPLSSVVARSFNHTGPGQPPSFVVPDFCKQAIEVKRGSRKHIVVGNLEAVRDFTDVRDTVRAYRLLIEKGVSGVFNVCSGRGSSIQEVLEHILSIVGISEDCVRPDQTRMRPNDIPKLVGDNEKISRAVLWKPEIPFLDKTLTDIIDYLQQANS